MRSRRAIVVVDGSVRYGIPKMFVLVSGSPSRMILAVARTRGRISPTNASLLTSSSSAITCTTRNATTSTLHTGERRASEPAHQRAPRFLGHQREGGEREQHDDVDVAGLGSCAGGAGRR